MQSPEVIHRQNVEATIKGCRDKFVGRTVTAVDPQGKSVTGVVQHVSVSGRRIEYFLASRQGPFYTPELVVHAADEDEKSESVGPPA